MGLIGKVVAGSAIVVLAASCREPTQILLRITTDVPCAALRGVEIALSGTSSTAELALASASTYGCRDGFVGTLTIVPAGDRDGAVVVRVTAAIDGDVQRCTKTSAYSGCIVARRRLRFLENTPLALNIPLYDVCKSVACTEDTTCSRAGRCVDATVDPAMCTSEEGCALPGDLAPGADGSVASDATGASDARRDGDAANNVVNDASPDGAPGVGHTVDRVQCGVTACDVTAVLKTCCIDPPAPTRSCAPACTGFLAACDDDSDCHGATPTCCAQANALTCAASCLTAVAHICKNDTDCPGSRCIGFSAGPEYTQYRHCQ